MAEIYADRENLKEKLENLNMEIRRELFSETFIKYLHDEYRDTDRREATALQQLDDHFHTYWAALPFGNSEKYEEKYKELERAMGAVKNLRKFEQLSVVTPADDQTEKRDGSKHNRCKICGERTPLFINNGKNLQHNLKPGERLCAVCYQKRCFEKKITDAFPSTAAVSLAYWINQTKTLCADQYEAYKKIWGDTADAAYSEQYLIRYNLRENRKNSSEEDRKRFELAQNRLNELEKALSDKLVSCEMEAEIKYRYYAIMAFDGDDMGKWISGQYFKKDEILKAQSELSQALGEYADWVKREIRKDQDFSGEKIGSIVYAGGEDLLALVPLKNLFLVMELLRSKFKEMVSDKVAGYTMDGRELTFSMGVVLAHYKTPLYYVLRMVRDMEKAAKQYRKEKNAVAMCLLKRSGEVLQAQFPWEAAAGEKSYITSYLNNILKDFRTNQESLNFIRKLHSEFEPVTIRKDEQVIEEFLIESEVNRLLQKSVQSKSITPEVKQNLFDNLCAFLKAVGSGNRQFVNFIFTLYICEFMRRSQNED
ncbi:MAG: type III-B CRISPR-associated protein Cas10/Cmr2 [Lachnospiraceae bacterium]|nr:type III-B CRISPR-associated protein Cas10/Cmr2 [Lachnospiraceae bacterium]